MALEQELDKRLASKEYWINYIADKDVTYGFFDNFSELLFCDKNSSKLTHISILKDHNLKKREPINTIIGGRNGDKQKEGDLKTPIGVYTFNEVINNPDPFYGPLAFVTSYPNSYDISQNKSGSGIWIHGYPLKGTRFSYSKGCLVINNKSLISLNQSIDYKKAVLVIAPSYFPKTNKDKIVSILAQLYQWRNYWKASLIQPYLSFYNLKFKSLKGLSLAEFSRYKKNIFNNKIRRDINFYNISIIPYPNENNRSLYYISFTEQYNAGKVHFNGKKELYVEYTDEKLSILTEN